MPAGLLRTDKLLPGIDRCPRLDTAGQTCHRRAWRMSGETQNPKWTVCSCTNCGEHLEFDPENAGETITCPHCGKQTVLFLPEPPKAPQPARQMVKGKIVGTTVYRNDGIELRAELLLAPQSSRANDLAHALEVTGNVLLVLGILGGIIGFFVWAGSMDRHNESAGLTAMIIGAAAAGQGFVLRLLCHVGAEILRLLNHSHTAKIGGKIIQYSALEGFKCSVCNVPAKPGQKSCPACGAEFTY